MKTAIIATPSSNRRAEVIELIMTGSGLVTPADIGHQATACFASNVTPGLGTGVTAEKMSGQGSPAAGTSIMTAATFEPTTYATVFPVAFGFNQRGGQRWAVPQGEGLKLDSGATNMRMGWRVQSSAAGNIDSAINHWEDFWLIPSIGGYLAAKLFGLAALSGLIS